MLDDAAGDLDAAHLEQVHEDPDLVLVVGLRQLVVRQRRVDAVGLLREPRVALPALS